jgi:hypothetical protein
VFYRTYVVGDRGNEFYHRVKRFRQMGNHSFAANRARLAARLEGLLASRDANMALFKSRVADHYGRLLAGQELFEAMLAPDQLATLQNLQTVSVHEDRAAQALAAYVAACTPTQASTFRRLFGLTHDMRTRTVVGRVAKHAFAVTCKRAGKTSKVLDMCAGELKEFEAAYAPDLSWV